MKTYASLSFFLLTFLLSSSLQARTTRLEQWQFSRDGIQWEEVSVPHSCNAVDGRSASYYRGQTRYRCYISPDPSKSSFLLFEGAAQAARIYVNDSLAFAHKGGYTPFVIPLKGFVRPGGNLVEVVCDNSVDLEMIPVSSDFNKNNGLHNPVSLLEFEGVYFCPVAYGPGRFHLVQSAVSEAQACAQVEAQLVNSGQSATNVSVRLVLRDAKGRKVWKQRRRVTVPAGGSLPFSAEIKLKRPHLWNGVKDPYLYTVELKVGKDAASGEVGFRFFRLDRDKGFFLNGKPYPLRGVSMHQDMEGKASALTEEDFERDYAIVRELGCNFLRLAHYPHNDYVFRICDRMGIVVQTEIPWVNICGTRATQAYFDNIHSQMREMITSLYNHPSIIFWGMWNELDSWGNTDACQGPLDARRVVDETARLFDYAKQLDSTRVVGLTDDSVFARDFYTELRSDYYSENRYHGWYFEYNRFDGLTPSMEWIHHHMGVTNLSEYGVGINPFCHTWKEEDIRRYSDDRRHMEEYGNRSHESHVQQICAMPWLNFTSLWILFDFAVADRKEGFLDSDDGVNFVENPARLYTNDKGLVTRDRITKKDVFYLYKSWWNKDVETVYITGRRLNRRPAGSSFTLTVYSNAPSLTLLRDGVPVKTLRSSGEISGVIWKFEGLEMGSSETRFEVVSPSGTQDSISFLPLLGNAGKS
ncbi:MAG: hypothetical protein IKX34_01670 [Bacteroidales bacterium]|nr:hypothetical protein [Bacteroidales bacterium]